MQSFPNGMIAIFEPRPPTPPKERNQFQWVVALIAVEDAKPQPASVNLSDS
jgi:hypothetical protein